MTGTYSLMGMHCNSCVAKISKVLASVEGVTGIEVTLDPPQAKLRLSTAVPREVIDTAVRSAGEYKLGDAVIDQRDAAVPTAQQESLFPLLLIVGYLAGASIVGATNLPHHSLHEVMRLFMAGFFIVFSFFKFLNLRGFADAYQGYDVVAQAWPAWAWIYPFVELGLGIAYLADINLRAINWLTLVLMLVGSIGVFNALAKRRAIRCACLGTVLNLPMTTVTLVEDLGMAAMAAYMLVPG